MSRARLQDVLQPALQNGYAIAGLVVLGFEDAKNFIAAAEAENCPVILQAGPGFRAHMPLEIIGPMFAHLAHEAKVPVVTHLDHSTDMEECRKALKLGFSSVMFDGSRFDLVENIARTAEVAAMAHEANAGCEGEIGFVGYAEGEPGSVTDAQQAGLFARETGVDALAISVGNVHLQTSQQAQIDFAAIAAIEAETPVPLVLHGGSGIPVDVRRKLARETNICKFNIGTELRQAFGQSLRDILAKDAKLFDRISMMKQISPAIIQQTQEILRNIKAVS